MGGDFRPRERTRDFPLGLRQIERDYGPTVPVPIKRAPVKHHLGPPDTMSLIARGITEDILTRTANAMLAGDFDALNACFNLPFTVETYDKKIRVRTVEDHRAIFKTMVDGYAMRGVTDIVRDCEAAEFITPTLIRSLHVSHVMAGTQRLDDYMPTLSTIEKIADRWCVTHAQYVGNTTQPVIRAIERHAQPRG